MTNEKTVKVQKGYDLQTNTLNGRCFISDKEEEVIERDCSKCFYRGADDNPGRGDCYAGSDGRLAKEKFGYKKRDIMPFTIDGKKVAHFCPYFRLH